MTDTDVPEKKVSPLGNHLHHVSQQPIDRHLGEITDKTKSVFINAGLDSTCGKKRASIIHKFIDGTIISSNIDSSASVPVDNMPNSLTLNHPVELKTGEESSTSVCGSDIHTHECCAYCGK